MKKKQKFEDFFVKKLMNFNINFRRRKRRRKKRRKKNGIVIELI